MRGAGATVIAAAALLLSTAAGNAQGIDWATALVSPGLTNHRAALTLKLHYEMTCGQPGPGPAVVHLPVRMKVLPTLAVSVNGKRTQVTTAPTNTITVELPHPPAVTCMSIGMGTLTINLAGVRNPARCRHVLRARALRDCIHGPASLRSSPSSQSTSVTGLPRRDRSGAVLAVAVAVLPQEAAEVARDLARATSRLRDRR